VKQTGQVGLVKLFSCVKFHQGVRIEMACGGKALTLLGKVYEQNRYWMDTVTRYRRHHAPGEGWTRTDDERVGFAYYEQEDGKRLAIFANFAETPLTVRWSTPRDGRSGEITVPPLEIVTQLQ
jgi:hypothetical protein